MIILIILLLWSNNKPHKLNLNKETIEYIDSVEIQKAIYKSTSNIADKKVLNEMNKKLTIMKDKDRFNNKAKFLHT